MAQKEFSVKSKMVPRPCDLDMLFLVKAISTPQEGCGAKGMTCDGWFKRLRAFWRLNNEKSKMVAGPCDVIFCFWSQPLEDPQRAVMLRALSCEGWFKILGAYNIQGQTKKNPIEVKTIETDFLKIGL